MLIKLQETPITSIRKSVARDVKLSKFSLTPRNGTKFQG